MVGISYLVDDEEQVADIKGDVAAYFRIEDDVAHCTLPDAVEVYAYKVAVSIDDRAS